jgi:hypothetical protein
MMWPRQFVYPVLSSQKCSVLFKITDLSLETGKEPKKKGLCSQKSLDPMLSSEL